MIDPIADFLTRLRNAQMARNNSVELPYRKIIHQMAEVMKKNNFIKKVEKIKDNNDKFFLLKIELTEDKKINPTRVSKCGQRIYTNAENIRKVCNGLGISIISTSQGIMTGYEARSKNIGGEVLCEVF